MFHLQYIINQKKKKKKKKASIYNNVFLYKIYIRTV